MRDGIVAAIQIPLARLGFDSNRSGIGISSRTEFADVPVDAARQVSEEKRGPVVNVAKPQWEYSRADGRKRRGTPS